MDYLTEFRRMAGDIGPKLCEALELPTTTHDWQLYHNYKASGDEGKPMKGATEAAKALTAALQKAEAEVRKKLGKGATGELGRFLADIFAKYIEPVQSKHAKVGAGDTEPRTVAKDYLEKVANEVTGHSGFIDF